MQLSSPNSKPGDLPPASDPGSNKPVAVRRPLALVVEDDLDAATVAEHMLMTLDYRVQKAEDALQALTWLSDHRPDLILLDICLPTLDGVAFAKVLRRTHGLETLPIIAASGIYKSGSRQVDELRQLGVRTFLAKPFGLRALRSALDSELSSPVVPSTFERGGTRAALARLAQGWEDVLLIRCSEDSLCITGRRQAPDVGAYVPIEIPPEDDIPSVALLARVDRIAADGPQWEATCAVHAAQPRRALEQIRHRLLN